MTRLHYSTALAKKKSFSSPINANLWILDNDFLSPSELPSNTFLELQNSCLHAFVDIQPGNNVTEFSKHNLFITLLMEPECYTQYVAHKELHSP
jgi:hypothetical protein